MIVQKGNNLCTSKLRLLCTINRVILRYKKHQKTDIFGLLGYWRVPAIRGCSSRSFHSALTAWDKDSASVKSLSECDTPELFDGNNQLRLPVIDRGLVSLLLLLLLWRVQVHALH